MVDNMLIMGDNVMIAGDIHSITNSIIMVWASTMVHTWEDLPMPQCSLERSWGQWWQKINFRQVCHRDDQEWNSNTKQVGWLAGTGQLETSMDRAEFVWHRAVQSLYILTPGMCQELHPFRTSSIDCVKCYNNVITIDRWGDCKIGSLSTCEVEPLEVLT